MGGSGGWMLVYAGQTAWRVFSGEEAGTQGDHGPLMVGQHWRLQEATTEHTGCCRRAPWLSWLTGTSPLTSSSKEWKWGVYTHTLPTIKECNYTKILHVGNGRRVVEEMLNSVRPRASVYQCTLQNSVEIVKPGSMFLLQYIIGEGLCVCVFALTGLNITHSHITSTCLLCCITGSKAKRPSPKIKKLYD